MVDKVTSWKFVEDYTIEPETIRSARRRAAELGVNSITPATGALLAALAAASQADTIVEIGTGAGVSTLWLFQGAPHAVVTSIDPEITYQDAARTSLDEAGIPSRQVRFIGRRALDVIGKLADNSYGLVVIDADAENLDEYLQHSIRLSDARRGMIVILGVLHHDRTANPAARDTATQAYRGVLSEAAQAEHFHAALLDVGDGVLLLTRTQG
ncbi:MAG TPA: methyltransferase [Pseudoclavibacter sp.]|nr:methyltransferase [Pseudoclavibacter sp.]